jgi:hypothetical protein
LTRIAGASAATLPHSPQVFCWSRQSKEQGSQYLYGDGSGLRSLPPEAELRKLVGVDLNEGFPDSFVRKDPGDHGASVPQKNAATKQALQDGTSLERPWAGMGGCWRAGAPLAALHAHNMCARSRSLHRPAASVGLIAYAAAMAQLPVDYANVCTFRNKWVGPGGHLRCCGFAGRRGSKCMDLVPGLSAALFLPWVQPQQAAHPAAAKPGGVGHRWMLVRAPRVRSAALRVASALRAP